MNGDTKESPEVQGIFRKYQHHVSRCIAIATSLTVLVSAVAYKLIPASSLSMTPLNTVTSRVVFTLRWNALTVAVLPVIITIIGLLRGSSNQQNPLSTVDRDKVEVHLRVLQNTVEQFATSFAAQLMTSTWLDASQMSAIPIVVVLFVIGRILFWIGYTNPARNRTDRAYGMPLTLFPLYAMVGFSVYKLVTTTFG